MKKTFSKEILFDRTPRVFKRDATEVRFLLGGIGTGNFSVNSRGKFLDWEIFNWPSKNTKFPLSFFAIRTENKELERPISKILESRMVPPYTSSHGYLQAELVNLPRMEDSELICEYPFARVNFKDSELPVKVSMEAYTPFIPLNTDDSSIPCAIIRYTVKNIADCPTKVSLVGTLPNASGFEGYDVIENLKLADSVKNEYREFDDVKGLYYSPEHLKEDHLRYGNMAILTSGSKVTYKTQWFDGEWVDGIQDFWDDFTSDGRLEKETVSDSVGCEFAQFHNFSFLKRREKIGSIGAWEELQPGEERTFEFVITWYFPNRVKAWIEFDEDYEKFQRGEYGTVRNYYATKFTDAWDVAKYVYHNKERLESDSRKFADAMFHKTTLPYYVVDALTANITNLRSNLCFRLEDGTFAGFEGIRDYIGCGYGSVPHVWNYAQTVGVTISTLVDATLVGNFIGSTGLAVANIATPVFLLYLLMGITLGGGAGVLIGKKLGEADLKGVNRVFGSVLSVGLITGVLFAAVSLVFRSALCSLLGATPELLPQALQYLNVVFAFAPIYVLYNILSIAVRTDGAPKLAAISSAGVIVTNLSLDLLFMKVLT